MLERSPSSNLTDPWSPDRVDLLQKLWMEGSSASEIADILGHGVTRNAVIGKVHRLRLKRATTPAGRAQESRATVAVQRRKGHVGKLQPNAIIHRVAHRPTVNADEAIDPGVDVTGRLGIMNLNQHSCRWPMVGTGAATLFCGMHTVEGKPYCQDHCRTAYAQERAAK